MMKNNAKKIAILAVMTATLVAGKFALSMIANVEIVSLLTAVYAYTFGFTTIIAVVAFVLIEALIYGFAPWVLAYFVFWGGMCLTFAVMAKYQYKNLLIILLAVIILTFSFGVVSSFIDIVFSGVSDFLYRFGVYYLRGLYFYLVHIISNVIVFALLFNQLVKILIRLKQKLLNE